MTFERGQRGRIPHRPDLPGHVLIEMANQVGDSWLLFVEQATGTFAKVELTASQAQACEVLTEDGAGDSAALLAGLCTIWMRRWLGGPVGGPRVDAAAALRPPDERRLPRDAPAAPAPVPARGRARHRQLVETG